MDKKSFWLGLATGVIALCITAYIGYNRIANQPQIEVDAMEITSLDGKKISWDVYSGKPIVVNYWGTWCAPCIVEFEHFETLKAEYGDEIQFVMVSDEKPQKVKSFVNKNDYSFDFVLTEESLSNQGIIARPTTYFYDKNSNLVIQHTSSITEAQLRAYIKQIR
ncbi:MAG: TlpA family protein disulfide reductase [Nonlabens sp.]|uniref:TlpA family protein disulfide reductase n=1 Tax=Nonlabens sp. TaxID=1888209 RepID=UPI003EF588B0